jgi:hypothetical protein
MSILGNSESSAQLLKNLDERKLVDLCADLLTLQGHREIKITDGPGDGERDIHSITKLGEKYLTQSKFHGKLSYTVSSKELGELVLGMVKHGYKNGLFITNSKISPQAKRECLNDYPNLSIDFIDGIELAKRVFDNLILRALWYDGESLNRVSSVLIVPILIRDLEQDRPLSLTPSGQDSYQGSKLETGRTKVQPTFRRSFMNASVFEPYRLPQIKTISESDQSQMILTEAILSGVVYLEDLDDLLPLLGKEAFRHLKTLSGKARNQMPYQKLCNGT